MRSLQLLHHISDEITTIISQYGRATTVRSGFQISIKQKLTNRIHKISHKQLYSTLNHYIDNKI